MKVSFIVPPSRHSRNVARDLVYGCWCKGNRIGGAMFPPVSLALLATVARNAGHTVAVHDYQVEPFGDAEHEALSRADAVVVLSSTPTIVEDTDLLRELKSRNPSLVTAAFGGAVKFEPKAYTGRGLDYAIVDEPEAVVPELLRALETGQPTQQVAGLCMQLDDVFHQTPKADWIWDLDSLPIPDRSLLSGYDYPNPQVRRRPWTTVFTNRGCPARCTFCSSPYYQGRKLRLRSAEVIFQELQQLTAAGYKEVFFRDETFPASRKRVVELCQRMIDARLDLTWVCSSRVDTVDEELLGLMKRAGCHTIRFGVESGVQELLDRVKKDITVDQVREVFAACHRAGLRTHAHMMLGLPGETTETIERTFDFVDEIDPTTITYGMLTPYPGTPLFDELAATVAPELAHDAQPDLSRLHTLPFHNARFTELSDEQLEEALRRAYRRFYLRPGYLLRWIGRVRSPAEAARAASAGWKVMSYAFGYDR